MSTLTKRPTESPPLPRTVGGSAWIVALCVLFTLALRAPFVTGPLTPDEAGLLLVAQNWDAGPFVYGDYWVDRPFGIVAAFWLADAVPGSLGVRLLGCVVAVGMVVAAGWAGHLLGGRSGATWAGVAAAAFASSYAFTGHTLNGKLLGATLVLASCACTIAAVRSRHSVRQAGYAVTAGVAATAAVLVQQSFVGGMAFAAVWLLVGWRRGLLTGAATGRMLVSGLGGLLLPVLGLLVWSWWSGPTLGEMWHVMYGYRLETLGTLSGGSLDEPMWRLVRVVEFAVLSGMAFIVYALVRGRRVVRERPEQAAMLPAMAAMAALMLAGMVAGGSWWADYLLQPIPVLVLAVGLVAPQLTRWGRQMRRGVVVAAAAAVVALALALTTSTLGGHRTEAALGGWLRASAEAGDTAHVVYGHANVLHAADMTSPYPYLWSLPVRTLDQDLSLLVSTLRGPQAPTWVVAWNDVDSWTLNQDGALSDVLSDRYLQLGELCGKRVFLLRGADRDLAPPPCT